MGSKIIPKCVFGLRRRSRIACTPKEVFFLTFLETRFQDGRSGLQGVPKGCQRVAPWDPNVAPAVSNVTHGADKVAAGVSKGAQRVSRVIQTSGY